MASSSSDVLGHVAVGGSNQQFEPLLAESSVLFKAVCVDDAQSLEDVLKQDPDAACRLYNVLYWLQGGTDSSEDGARARTNVAVKRRALLHIAAACGSYATAALLASRLVERGYLPSSLKTPEGETPYDVSCPTGVLLQPSAVLCTGGFLFRSGSCGSCHGPCAPLSAANNPLPSCNWSPAVCPERSEQRSPASPAAEGGGAGPAAHHQLNGRGSSGPGADRKRWQPQQQRAVPCGQLRLQLHTALGAFYGPASDGGRGRAAPGADLR